MHQESFSVASARFSLRFSKDNGTRHVAKSTETKNKNTFHGRRGQQIFPQQLLLFCFFSDYVEKESLTNSECSYTRMRDLKRQPGVKFRTALWRTTASTPISWASIHFCGNMSSLKYHDILNNSLLEMWPNGGRETVHQIHNQSPPMVEVLRRNFHVTIWFKLRGCFRKRTQDYLESLRREGPSDFSLSLYVPASSYTSVSTEQQRLHIKEKKMFRVGLLCWCNSSIPMFKGFFTQWIQMYKMAQLVSCRHGSHFPWVLCMQPKKRHAPTLCL